MTQQQPAPLTFPNITLGSLLTSQPPPEVDGLTSLNSHAPAYAGATRDEDSDDREVSLSTSGVYREVSKKLGEVITTEEVSRRLEVLLQAIQTGARAGYAVRLPAVSAKRVQRLRHVDWSALTQDQAESAVRAAGLVTTLALLVKEYEDYCHVLEQRGVDTLLDMAPLVIALAHKPVTAVAS